MQDKNAAENILVNHSLSSTCVQHAKMQTGSFSVTFEFFYVLVYNLIDVTTLSYNNNRPVQSFAHGYCTA